MNREATKIRKKTELLANAKKYQTALSNELNLASARAVDFGKNMAVIGGILYVGYTILDRILETKLYTRKKDAEPGKFETLNKMILPLLAMALQQGSTILLKRARVLLINYLEEKSKADV